MIRLLAALAILLVTSSVLAAIRPTADEYAARLNSCDPEVVKTAAREILAGPLTRRDPVLLYLASQGQRRVGDRREAGFLLVAAHLSASRAAIVQGGDSRQVYSIYAGMIDHYVMPSLESDPELADAVVRRAAAWDRETPDENRESAAARKPEAVAKLVDAEAGIIALPEKLRADPARVAKARQADDAVEGELAREKAHRCQAGKLDPVDIPSTRERIEREGERFAAAHPLVKTRAKGPIRSVNVSSSSSRDWSLPGRLTMSVQPEAGERFYAEIDVLARVTERKLESIDFSLACLTGLWIGQRDSRWRDLCTGDPDAQKP